MNNCKHTNTLPTHASASTGFNYRCLDCGLEWYYNRCWQCKKDFVSYTQETRCVTCGWHVCASCGSCDPQCDHRVDKLIAEIDELKCHYEEPYSEHDDAVAIAFNGDYDAYDNWLDGVLDRL